MSASATQTKAHETLMFLANFNSWRRGDETIEMPSPAEIGAAIDDAINLLRKYDSAEAERDKLRAEVERLTKDRDDWKAKHWKAHDDYQRLFTEVPNLVTRAESAEAELIYKVRAIRDLARVMRDQERELAIERSRLDWLTMNATVDGDEYRGGSRSEGGTLWYNWKFSSPRHGGDHASIAIDVAMKEGSK